VYKRQEKHVFDFPSTLGINIQDVTIHVGQRGEV
jgi:hypothetical protein